VRNLTYDQTNKPRISPPISPRRACQGFVAGTGGGYYSSSTSWSGSGRASAALASGRGAGGNDAAAGPGRERGPVRRDAAGHAR